MKKIISILAMGMLTLLLVGMLGCGAMQNQNSDQGNKPDIGAPNGQLGDNQSDSQEGNPTDSQEDNPTDSLEDSQTGKQKEPDHKNNPKQLQQGDGVKSRILTENYPAEISAYLEENKTKETQRALNVNNKTYLVLTMGQCPTAGYHIELTNLSLQDGKLIVQAKYVKPNRGDIVATVITYPSLVIETDDIYEGHYLIEFNIDK
ncbi:MAG: protease complex subunit PrcB family protein [Peptococcaceae bacterium]|nr:protease complex subunit PrcB family protein [Peptococcaceae bacterium]